MSDLSFGSGNAGFQLGINSGSVHYYALEQPEPTPCPLSTVPFPRDPDFVERGALLDNIRDKLSLPGERVALVGLGGIGKSQLAIEYSYRIRDSSPQTWVFWIHASNAARIEQGFQMLADRVKIPGCQSPSVNIFRLVYSWLCVEKHGPWVLILDNVDDDSHLRQPLVFSSQSSPLDANLDSQFNGCSHAGISGSTILQFLPRVSHGSILVTTRSLGVASRLVRESSIVTVGSMNRSEASSLMMASLGNQYSQEGIEDLCETLEFIPLAIVQAGAYIKKRAPRCSALQYLDNFRKNDRKRTKLLKNEGQGLQRDEQASNSILITWQISFEHVREIRASAADLLSLMSFFDHQGIVESALRISSGAQKTDETSSRKRRRDSTDSDVQFEADYEFGEDIVILRDFSFISSTQVPHTFQMHALVQLATRSWLEDHNQISQWRNQFIENISYEFGGSDEEYARWQERQILFPHVKSALDHRPDSPQHLKTWASLMQRGAAHAVENSNHQDTLRMASKSLETMKSIFGAQHDNTLLSLNMMATALIIGGKFNDAQAMLETALADSDNDLACKEHVRTEIMYSLGLLYHLTDRQLEAEPLLKKAIEGTTNRSCPSERDTLTCMHTLANVYCRQGRYSEGEDLALRAMEGAIKNLGERDYTTLRSMSTLARFYFAQKRYQEAATLQRQALNSAESFFGKGNLRSHEFGHALARTYAKQGNFEEAERLYRSANDVFRAVLGDEHITAISSSAELAEFFIQRGRFIDALPILEEIVDICSRVIGRQHSSTIKYSSQLGFTYCILSRFGEAELVLKNTIEASERNFREDSHHDAREDMFSQELSLYTLASIYHIQGRLNEAEPIIAKLVKGATEQHGENASVTLRYVGQLAGNYKEQERWHEALSLQMKILNIRKEILGESHEDTLAAMEGLAETWELMGQADDAMEMLNTITTLRSEAANKSS